MSKQVKKKNKEVDDFLKRLPKEAQEKIKNAKKTLDAFKNELLKKFDKYVVGLAILPPTPQQPIPQLTLSPTIQSQVIQTQDANKINAIVLIDDSDSKTMSQFELKTKLSKIINEMAKKHNNDLIANVVLLNEIWQNCLDQKYDLVRLIAMSYPIYDKGTLAAIKIAEIHKEMVVKKFERYIVSYVLAGSIVQGKATPESDIDVFIVIDDTDVKRMTRFELKEKLRAIIISMGIEAGELTGIRNKLNIQVYILTDFWDSVREANPIIFTFLRDGIPLHDIGTFLPWKHLLKMGKVKPSQEAIDLYMNSGEEILKRVQRKLTEIGMEDTYWAILTPSQAALMLYGVPPPTPRETPELMQKIFVEKEKILEEKYVKILENNIKVRKDLEHGKLKKLTGEEADKLLRNAEEYLKRIQKLFETIRERKEKENVAKDYDSVISLARDVLKLEGVSYVKDSEIAEEIKEKLVDQGKLESKYYRKLNQIIKFYRDYEVGKITKAEISAFKKDITSLTKRLTEYIQMVQNRAVERCKITVKHGDKFGEIFLLKDKAFIVFDIEAQKKEVAKATIKKGKIINIKESSIEELDNAIANEKLPERAFIKESLFEDLKKYFGKEVEILIRR